MQTVGECGEFALIDAIAQRLGTPSADRVPLGIGDDAAVISTPGGRTVACLDMLTQGVHFRLDWSEAHDIGRKAAAQNLADICAMGAKPTALLVGIGLPASTTVKWVLEFADGLREEAEKLDVHVVGGDVVRADSISISVTALGTLTGDPIVRSGAQPGDIVAVAGGLGFSAAGLHMLQRGFRSPRALVNAHRVPTPPYALALAAGHATSMIDVSDGLASDLGHVARASGVDIAIDSAAFTVPEELAAAASAFQADALQWIITGGEDHAFAATFSNALDVPSGWNIIGHVKPGTGQVLLDDAPLASRGWDHFA